MGALTVVVGAGASCEYGFPTGIGLKQLIAKCLKISIDDVGRARGDDEIIEAIRCKERDFHGARAYADVMQHICAAMPQAPSIDNYIHTHRGQPKIEFCGKLAIALSILRCEQKSNLFIDPSNFKAKLKFDGTIEGSWLNQFFMLYTKGCDLAELEARLRSLKFIVFNYDRCVEHFLFNWIRNYYYKISDDKAAELAQAVEIVHPYGAIGRLPWQDGGGEGVAFGASLRPEGLVTLSSQIKTFTEGTGPHSSSHSRTKQLIRHSARLLFLGFGFEELNMELLASGVVRPSNGRLLIGSAYKVSEHNRILARAKLQYVTAIDERTVILDDVVCNDLIGKYSGSIGFLAEAPADEVNA